MSPNELAIAQSEATATWLGAVSNLLVVCVTLAFATREARDRWARKRADAALARRKFREGTTALASAADDALSFYPVDAPYPGELVRVEIDRRSGAAFFKLERVIVMHLSEKEQALYEDAFGIFAELHGALSAARYADTMDVEALRMFHVKVGAWRAKVLGVMMALS